MTFTLSRARLLGGVTALAGTRLRAPAEAARHYRFGHALGTEHPIHVRSVQMWAAVAKETGGQLIVDTFANSALGGQAALVTEVRQGAVDMMALPTASAAGLVPALGITGVGFAYHTLQEVWKSMDGPLGEALRREVEAKDLLIPVKETYELGLRQVSDNIRPIRSAADIAGLKLRVPLSRIAVDMWRTLGASPIPLDSPETYTGLQSHLIDGTELPLATIDSWRLAEVQRYIGIINHSWAGLWLAVNPGSWNALSPEIQAVVRRNASKYINLQRRDVALMEDALRDKLHRQGMEIDFAPADSFRAKLRDYYVRWKAEFGATLWGLLEQTSGHLG